MQNDLNLLKSLFIEQLPNFQSMIENNQLISFDGNKIENELLDTISNLLRNYQLKELKLVKINEEDLSEYYIIKGKCNDLPFSIAISIELALECNRMIFGNKNQSQEIELLSLGFVFIISSVLIDSKIAHNNRVILEKVCFGSVEKNPSNEMFSYQINNLITDVQYSGKLLISQGIIDDNILCKNKPIPITLFNKQSVNISLTIDSSHIAMSSLTDLTRKQGYHIPIKDFILKDAEIIINNVSVPVNINLDHQLCQLQCYRK